MHRLQRWWWHWSRCNLQSSVYSRSPWCTKCQWRRENRNLNTTGSSRDLVTLACLTLSAISLGLAMQGWWGGSCMLTSSQPKQHAPLAALAQQSSNLVPPLAPLTVSCSHPCFVINMSTLAWPGKCRWWAIMGRWNCPLSVLPSSMATDHGLRTLCLLTYLIR